MMNKLLLRNIGLLKLAFLALVLLTSQSVICQTVPSKMEFAGMDLTISSAAKKKIQASVDALVRSPKHFQIKVDRAHLYFPYIEQAFEAEGLPNDFKYLIIQESGMVSDAVSSSNAVGFWQFKDFTAKEVGLAINSKVDERKHIIKSSHAAAKYLKQNNIQFGNWVYALQAYNTGVGGAKKTVDAKYFGKKKMAIESNTHWYVLKFLAHKVAFDDAFRKLDTQTLELVEYRCKNETMSSIAKKFDVELEELEKYNKWLKVPKVPNDRAYYSVMVPVKKEDAELARKKANDEKVHIAMENTKDQIKVDENINKKPEKLPGWFLKRKRVETTPDNPHIITAINGLVAIKARKGDTKDNLAINGGIRTKKFLKYNDVKSFHKIKPDAFYYLEAKNNKHFSRFHVVQPNETLWGISQKYGIKLKSLARKNRMKPFEPLKYGQKLWLKKRRPKDTPVEYVDVKIPEETLPKVEPKKEEEHEIRKAEEIINNLPEHHPTEIDSSEIHEEVEKELAQAREELKGKVLKYHTVKQKESMYSISKMYETTPEKIRTWNNLPNYNISIDQRLIVGWETLEEKSTPDPKKGTPNPKIIEEDDVDVDAENDREDVDMNEVEENEDDHDKETKESQPEQRNGGDTEEFIIHVVKQKETLYSISKIYGVSWQDIMKWNNKTAPTLDIDEKLKILKK